MHDADAVADARAPYVAIPASYQQQLCQHHQPRQKLRQSLYSHASAPYCMLGPWQSRAHACKARCGSPRLAGYVTVCGGELASSKQRDLAAVLAG